MIVGVFCEYSATVRDAFAKEGHEAWSIDILPTEGSPDRHVVGDAREYVERYGWKTPRGKDFDLIIAHPPCTYLALSGIHWNNRIEGRKAKTEEALEFVRFFLEAPVPMIALENPVGVISTYIRKPDQYIQPWEYGHPEAKKTGLWLKGLPRLTPTNVLEPIAYQENGKTPRWENQTPSGQNKLPPSEDRWKKRSLFYTGWAEAMAQQWGGLNHEHE